MTIEDILLSTLLLILIQIFIPVTIDLLITKKLNFLYLFSSRDDVTKTSLFFNRAQRALNNLFQTLPIFIVLAILSIIKNIDISFLATLWLATRIIYIPIYVFGIDYVRTIVWAISLVCLIMMGISFI
jgi:uncharacterized MAPEG superfamily protein